MKTDKSEFRRQELSYGLTTTITSMQIAKPFHSDFVVLIAILFLCCLGAWTSEMRGHATGAGFPGVIRLEPLEHFR